MVGNEILFSMKRDCYSLFFLENNEEDDEEDDEEEV